MKPVDGRSVVIFYLWSDFCRVGFLGAVLRSTSEDKDIKRVL